jgi:hypothetical protein
MDYWIEKKLKEIGYQGNLESLDEMWSFRKEKFPNQVLDPSWLKHYINRHNRYPLGIEECALAIIYLNDSSWMHE